MANIYAIGKSNSNKPDLLITVFKNKEEALSKLRDLQVSGFPTKYNMVQVSIDLEGRFKNVSHNIELIRVLTIMDLVTIANKYWSTHGNRLNCSHLVMHTMNKLGLIES